MILQPATADQRHLLRKWGYNPDRSFIQAYAIIQRRQNAPKPRAIVASAPRDAGSRVKEPSREDRGLPGLYGAVAPAELTSL